jgi:hypothetical protein
MNPARSRQMLADNQLRPQRVLSRPSDHRNSFGQHRRVHAGDNVTKSSNVSSLRRMQFMQL